MEDDATLLRAWRGGDAAAGRVLFERYFQQVTRFFVNKVPFDHEDLIQETFTACLRGRDRVRDEARFRSYLFGVAYNVLKKHYERRAGGRRGEPLESQAAADLAPGPSTLLRKRDRDRRLLDALRQLPLEQQLVLEMLYWEGMSSVEIGEALGISDATVRTRAHRGRERLLARLTRSTRHGAAGNEPLDDQRLDQWAQDVRIMMDAELSR